jgi:hypothetical protein
MFDGEPLKPDGTNFIDWYQRLRSSLLRSSLLRSNALFMILEPLGPRLGIDADQVEEDAFRDRRDYYTLAGTAIIKAVDPKMKGWFYNTDSNMIIRDLKDLFKPQV